MLIIEFGGKIIVEEKECDGFVAIILEISDGF